MEIRNPRRILCVGPEDSGVLGLLKELTGSSPDPKILTPPEAKDIASTTPENQGEDGASGEGPDTALSAARVTTAGLTHALPLVTKYYTATIPIWLDEVRVQPIAPPTTTADTAARSSDAAPTQAEIPATRTDATATGIPAWKADFLSPSATEVTASLGAWIVVFRKHGTTEYKQGVAALIAAVVEIVEQQGEGMWEGGMFALGMPGSRLVASSAFAVSSVDSSETNGSENEYWDDICLTHGFEYIDGTIGADEGSKRDEMGEVRGIARLKEALEACDWSGAQDGQGEDDVLGLDREEDELDEFGELVGPEEAASLDFGVEIAQMGNKFAGLSESLRRGLMDGEEWDEEDEARQVEELERMMTKMHAARDMSAHMPEEQRKRFAAKTVNDILNLG